MNLCIIIGASNFFSRLTMTNHYSSSIMSINTLRYILHTDPVIDPCETITCSNGGTCEDGMCLCASGFSGTMCEGVYT